MTIFYILHILKTLRSTAINKINKTPCPCGTQNWPRATTQGNKCSSHILNIASKNLELVPISTTN